MVQHRVGYAPGVYDLFHVGHLNILRHARSQCDYLVAGVVSDEMAA
ncbi:adenylyltransferase/cytidyltransferase family protein, partial [Streptomyces sp. b94]